MATNDVKIYEIRQRNEGIYYGGTVVADSWEEAEILAAAKDAELTGEIQEIYKRETEDDETYQYI